MGCGCRGTQDSPKPLGAPLVARPPERPVVRREAYTELNGTQRATRTTEEQ